MKVYSVQYYLQGELSIPLTVKINHFRKNFPELLAEPLVIVFLSLSFLSSLDITHFNSLLSSSQCVLGALPRILLHL